MNSRPGFHPPRVRRLLVRAVIVLAVLAAGVPGARAGKTLVQYGFDFTSGSVLSNGGGLILNDSGPSLYGFPVRGNGGTYSTDIPSHARFATGRGSLYLSTGSFSTNPPGVGQRALGPLIFFDIIGYQGFTMELWVKGGSANGIIMTICGGYVLYATPGGVHWANGFDQRGIAAAVDKTGWHHVACILANPVMSGEAMEGELRLYVDGADEGSLAGLRWTKDLNRSLALGNHPLLSIAEPWTGMVYEPRIAAGVLTPDEFMCAPPPAASAVKPATAVPVLPAATRSEIPGQSRRAEIVAWILAAVTVLAVLFALLVLRAKGIAVRQLRLALSRTENQP